MARLMSILAGIALALTACAQAGAAGAVWTYPPGTSSRPAAPSAQPVSSVAPAASAVTSNTLEITAFDLGFEPAMLEVPAAGRYTVKLVNTGATSHDITFPSGETALAKPGETGSVDVDVPAAGLTFCARSPVTPKPAWPAR